MTIAKINKGETLAQFKVRMANTIKQIVAGHGSNRELMQQITIEAFSHIETHGDHTILYPLYFDAACAFAGNLRNRWVTFVVNFTHLSFNPGNKVKGLKNLTNTANGNALFVKNKAKKMNVEGAKAKKWWNPGADKDKAKSDTSYDVKAATERFLKSVQNALNEGRATLGTTSAKYAKVTKFISDALAKLEPASITAGPASGEPKKPRAPKLKADVAPVEVTQAKVA